MQNIDNIESVIHRYSDTVYRLAFAKTGNKYDADDIFQEVFLRYMRKNPKFTDEEHRKAWFIRVTINRTNSFWSSVLKRKQEQLSNDIPFEIKEQIDLYNELQKLPDKYREVIHLFYYEDMSVEEISTVLNRKPSTVRTQLTRARRLLKDFIKEEDYV